MKVNITEDGAPVADAADAAAKGKKRKTGSGRKPNSFSFVKLPLSELLKKFADHETPIVVGRVWAQAVGFGIKNTVSANNLNESIEGLTPDTKVEVNVQELD